MSDKSTSPSSPDSKRHWLWGGMTAALAAVLSACGIKPRATPSTSGGESAATSPASAAVTPLAYRQDAARHLYGFNTHRIYVGKLPPLLYAVGTLEVNLGPQGNIRSFNWMRAPRHAPEVMKEIERTVREAAPFPVASKLGYVTYTDTWLWDKSGKFQLDTLTEGQRDYS